MSCEELLATLRAGGLLAPGRPLVAMISGGRDSTCLLDAAVHLLGPGEVTALHVNYGLREAAAEDERYCVALCKRLGARLETRRAPAPPGGPGGRGAGAGNLQAWARDLRYEAAQELASRLDANIATGHTASDQVETILYRLAASPGRRALLGMSPCEGRLVRPLLGVTREQTAAYCRERGISWRDDESNEDPRFARSRVRHGLLPALRAVHPGAESNVLRTAMLLRAETEVLESLVEQELAGGATITLERLSELPEAIARLVVVRLAEDAAGTYVPQAGDRVAEILALGRRGGPAELHLGGRAGAVISDGTLSMRRLPPRG